MSEEKALMSTHRYMPNESYERPPLATREQRHHRPPVNPISTESTAASC